MSKATKQTAKQIWVAVNKNGNVAMFSDEPSRNHSTGTWVSTKPYCNSLLQKDFEDMVKNAQVTWEYEPNVFEISLLVNNNE